MPSFNLKDLIVNLLNNIMPMNKSSLYVTPENMKEWTVALTHETADPTENYEDPEYGGDRVLKVAFIKYLKLRFPTFTSMELSNIDMLMMEQHHQSILSSEMGLHNYIVMPQQPPKSVVADVFESFFWELDKISDNILPESGFMHVFNMICYLFNQNVISEELRFGNPKMIVEQIFIQLGLQLEPLQFNHNIVTIVINKEQQEFFRKYDKEVPLIIGQGYGKNTNAYLNAKKTLESLGITQAWINQIKPKKEKELIKIKKELTTLIPDIINPILHKIGIPLKSTWEKTFDEDAQFDYMGEIYIKGFGAKWIMSLFPDYHKEEYNNIMTHIMENLDLFLVEDFKEFTPSTLKSFIGELDSLADNQLYGLGMVCCYRLIKLLIKPTLIPDYFKFKHPKTVVEQLLNPFFNQRDAKPIFTINKDDGYTMSLEFTQNQYDFLSKHFNVKQQIASVTGKLKKKTQKELYQKALEHLNDQGINPNTINLLKNKLEFNHPRLLPYVKQLKYYDYFQFITNKTPEVMMQLVGVKNNKKTILSSVIASDDKLNTKMVLLDMYLNYL